MTCHYLTFGIDELDLLLSCNSFKCKFPLLVTITSVVIMSPSPYTSGPQT